MQYPTIWLTSALFVVLTLAGFSQRGAEPPAEARAEAPAAPAAFEVAAFEIDQAHSTVGFKVRHLGLASVTGTFDDYTARLQLDPADLSTMEVAARIEVESIDTGNERRDGHLRSPDFFEAETHPDIRFESTDVTEVDGNAFKLAGDLTIHGVTRPVVLEGALLGTAEGPGGKQRVGIEAETTIDRRDFGLTWDNLTEAGGVIVGHDVKIFLEIEAVEAGA